MRSLSLYAVYKYSVSWVTLLIIFSFFFFKQKTAYEMRISDWSSDVCSSDLDLITDDFLNEERFAMAYASGKFRMNGWGRHKIKQGLGQKAVSAPLIRAALGSLDEQESRENLLHLLKIGSASCRERVCQYV